MLFRSFRLEEIEERPGDVKAKSYMRSMFEMVHEGQICFPVSLLEDMPEISHRLMIMDHEYQAQVFICPSLNL